MNSFSEKLALVTGSSRGIGRAAGLKLASCGAKVLFHGVRESENLSSAVAAAGNGAEALTADFGNMDEVRLLADELKKRRQIYQDNGIFVKL